jgi:hypothetical protein
MNIADLRNARAVAGAQYAETIRRLRENFIELAAIDEALRNGNVGHGEVVRGFNHLPQNAESFTHFEFSPVDLTDDWREAAKARRDQLIKAVTR